MSGDIQTRQRRKEKRKQKRDEPAIGVDTSNITEVEKKHVQMHEETDHHDVGWCAKVVFFILMAILTGLVVLIVLENRGGSDLDTPLSESRFSEYLKGWVDETREDDHIEEHFMNQDDENDHDTESDSFANDVILEEEKDGSDHEEDEVLDAEAKMFESETESPEANEAINSDASDSPDVEDSLPFEEDSAPLEEEEDDNDIEMEEFAESNDDGEDLLLQKISEQTKQDLEEEEEDYLKDKDEPESYRKPQQAESSESEELLSRRMTLVTSSEQNLSDDEELIEVMMITKTDGSKNVCLDSYEEENFQGSDDDHVPRTFEEFQKAFRSTSSKNTVLEPQSVDSDTEEKVVLELQNTPLSSENSDLEMEEEYIEEENSNEELSFEEEQEEDEEEEEEEDINSELDDTDLMKRLEAKYGKISGDVSSEDEDPDYQSWTNIEEEGEAQSYLKDIEEASRDDDNNLN